MHLFKGTALGRSTATDQAPSIAVKRVQTALLRISQLFGDAKYYPCPQFIDGKVGPCTVSALYNVIHDALAQIPVVNEVIDKLDAIPGMSAVLGNYAGGLINLRSVWGASEENDWMYEQLLEVVDLVISGAETIEPVLKHVIQLKEEGPAPVGIKTVSLIPGAITPPSPMIPSERLYPPGAFAVRDPSINMFRILVPLE